MKLVIKIVANNSCINSLKFTTIAFCSSSFFLSKLLLPFGAQVCKKIHKKFSFFTQFMLKHSRIHLSSNTTTVDFSVRCQLWSTELSGFFQLQDHVTYTSSISASINPVMHNDTRHCLSTARSHHLYLIHKCIYQPSDAQ